MKTVLLFCFLGVINSACKKCALPSDIPACIKSAIDANKNNSDWEVGNVEEYSFQGKIVYAFNPDTRKIADGATTVQTSDCKNLCSVGGFGGPAINMCNGDNFFQKAVLLRKIWEKP